MTPLYEKLYVPWLGWLQLTWLPAPHLLHAPAAPVGSPQCVAFTAMPPGLAVDAHAHPLPAALHMKSTKSCGLHVPV
jgi:hypothetical protein